MDHIEDERFARGWELIKEIFGEDGQRVIQRLNGISPDFARYTVEFPYGDVHSRPGLDSRTREIATVTALATLGTAPAQLRVHMHGALNVGVTRQELLELMIQVAVYAGFPAALNGIMAAQEVFDDRDARGLD